MKHHVADEEQPFPARRNRQLQYDVESQVKRFSSHEDSKDAEREYYRGLTPAQRLDILLELIDRRRDKSDASSERLERVYRIVKLSSS